MKKTIVIILAGIICGMLIAAGCTSTSGTTPATTTSTAPATPTATAEPSLTVITTAAPATEVPSWTGTWNTTYCMAGSADVIEALTLNQSGSSVTGTYGTSNYPVTGTVQEGTITGTWNETDKTGTYSGFFVFEKSSDGKSFSGRWVYTSEGADALKNTTQCWNGTRI